MPRKFGLLAVQGHPSSSILVSVESAFVINSSYGPMTYHSSRYLAHKARK